MRNRMLKLGGALAVVGVLAALLIETRADQEPAKQGDRRVFMRQKLEFAKNVLEGLSVEDYDAIAANARRLRRLSEAAEWETPTIPDVEQYVAYTADFQEAASDMVKKAQGKNLDGATLAYVQMTMTCVKCHKYVRDRGNKAK